MTGTGGVGKERRKMVRSLDPSLQGFPCFDLCGSLSNLMRCLAVAHYSHGDLPYIGLVGESPLVLFIQHTPFCLSSHVGFSFTSYFLSQLPYLASLFQ